MHKKNNLIVANSLVLGAGWLMVALIVGVSNDVVSKHLGNNLPPVQITFLRFLCGLAVLLPFMFWQGKLAWVTQRPGVHVIRGGLLFVGIALWCYGLTVVPLATATVINFTIPLFTLVLARIFLKEPVGLARSLVTCLGFVGSLIVLEPTKLDFEPASALLLLASALFAMLDIINKKFVLKETMLGMLFYGALVTAALGAIPAYVEWVPLSSLQWGLVVILGAGANLILFFLLKAFAVADASALAPFRYAELLFSAMAGYFLFSELPGIGTWLGAALIIPSSLYLIWYEGRKSRRLSAECVPEGSSA